MTKRGLLCAWGHGDKVMSLEQEQSCFLRAAALLCLGRWRGQDIPGLCCGRSKRGSVPLSFLLLCTSTWKAIPERTQPDSSEMCPENDA